jgi:hypothetical protein
VKHSNLARVGTWVAFVCAAGLALPQPPAAAHLALASVVGAVLILVGSAAAANLEPTDETQPSSRVTRVALSVLLGLLIGGALLFVLRLGVSFEPALRARFASRLGEPWWRPWALAFESSILEEVVFRLFALSVITWCVHRVLRREVTAFAIGLGGSALLFGLAHVPAWIAATQATPLLVVAVLLLNGLPGVLLGWLYWRWGLLCAIACHFAADVVVQAIGPRVLG